MQFTTANLRDGSNTMPNPGAKVASLFAFKSKGIMLSRLAALTHARSLIAPNCTYEKFMLLCPINNDRVSQSERQSFPSLSFEHSFFREKERARLLSKVGPAGLK
jgi:hypothetical protein